MIAQAGTAEEGIGICRELRPDIVLLDINLPAMSGIEAVPLIRKFAPGTKILVVSLHTQISYVKKMMQMGAFGYITKNASQQEMKDALMALNDGKKYICKEIKDILAGNISNDDRETDVTSLSVRDADH